jgi:hypothetical protein
MSVWGRHSRLVDLLWDPPAPTRSYFDKGRRPPAGEIAPSHTAGPLSRFFVRGPIQKVPLLGPVLDSRYILTKKGPI